MNIILTIVLYFVEAIIAFAIFGYIYRATAYERCIGGNYWEEKNDQAREEIRNAIDSSSEDFVKSIGPLKSVAFIVVNFLCWPISIPYALYVLYKLEDHLEDFIRTYE